MPGWDGLSVFIAAAIALGLAPGPDNIFVLTQSALAGRVAGLVVTLGLCTGLLVHTAAVALGVAAIFAASAVAFTILKYVGAAYLLFLAWMAFRTGQVTLAQNTAAAPSLAALYRRGIIMNITNPKVAIFFLAFLPQFADPTRGPIMAQVFIFGLVFICVTVVVFGAIAWGAGYLGEWLQTSPLAQQWLNRLAGLVFIALAAKLITASR